MNSSARPLPLASTAKIQQLLAGNIIEAKVQMTPQPQHEDSPWPTDDSHTLVSDLLEDASGGWCTASEPGQQFWIKEAFSYTDETRSSVVFKADFPKDTPAPVLWYRPFHMPRRLCRLAVVVLSVFVRSEPDNYGGLTWFFVRRLQPIPLTSLTA